MKRSFPLRDMALAALGAALIAVCSWISLPPLLPTGVPFTLQTFAVCLLAALFGWKLGMVTVGVWLLLGAVGLPVFAGFKGGLGALLGVTGGFMLGFVFTALIVGLFADKLGRKPSILLGGMVLGLLLCYGFGTAWFMLLYAKGTGPVSLGTALAWCVLPYLLPDGLKLALAALLAKRLYPILQKGQVS